MNSAAKNPSEQLLFYLKENFSQPSPYIGQFRDENIWIDIVGDIIVWNAKNMRYKHKVFKQEVGKGCHAEALEWLKNVYDGSPQSVPDKYAV